MARTALVRSAPLKSGPARFACPGRASPIPAEFAVEKSVSFTVAFKKRLSLILARVSVAPVRSHAIKRALFALAPVKSVPQSLASERSASSILASTNLAPERSDLARTAPVRSALLKSAPDKFAPSREAFLISMPLRSMFERSAPAKSFPAKLSLLLWPVRIAFLIWRFFSGERGGTGGKCRMGSLYASSFKLTGSLKSITEPLILTGPEHLKSNSVPWMVIFPVFATMIFPAPHLSSNLSPTMTSCILSYLSVRSSSTWYRALPLTTSCV